MNSSIVTSVFSASGPAYAAMVVVLTFIVGAIGSLYSSEIKNLRFWPTLIFMASMLLCGWLLYRQAATLQQLHEEEITRLQTMPSPEVMKIFATAYREAADLARQHKSRSDEEVRADIRTVLQGVAKLAYVFQRHSRVDDLGVPLRAAANIMLYLSPDAASQQAVKDRLRFLRGDVDPNSLDAILDLKTELSAYCAEGKALSPDQGLEPLALVVPKKRETPVGDKILSCVLPGAPRAYVSLSGIDDFPDASKLVDFCDQNDFLKSTHADLTRYLDSSVGRNIRSMSSFQVVTHNGRKHILNIHSNRTNLELGNEWIEQFHALIAPFSIVLADLLDQLVDH